MDYVFRNLRYVPHFLNQSQKNKSKKLSKALLQTIQKSKHHNYKLFYTEDESWFYLVNDKDQMWLPYDEIPQEIENRTIYSKKYMITIFWNPNGFHLV